MMQLSRIWKNMNQAIFARASLTPTTMNPSGTASRSDSAQRYYRSRLSSHPIFSPSFAGRDDTVVDIREQALTTYTSASHTRRVTYLCRVICICIYSCLVAHIRLPLMFCCKLNCRDKLSLTIAHNPATTVAFTLSYAFPIVILLYIARQIR